MSSKKLKKKQKAKNNIGQDQSISTILERMLKWVGLSELTILFSSILKDQADHCQWEISDYDHFLHDKNAYFGGGKPTKNDKKRYKKALKYWSKRKQQLNSIKATIDELKKQLQEMDALKKTNHKFITGTKP